MKKLLEQLSSFITVGDLMTKEIKFYKGNEEDIKFCKLRDIDRLPIKDSHSYMLFNWEKETFEKKEMLEKEIIEESLCIDKFINKTRTGDLFFVFKNKHLVGIIHFCDLINSIAYVYFYAIFNLFESQLRLNLKKQSFSNTDVLNWLKENPAITPERIKDYECRIKKIHLPEFQHFDFTNLVKFAVSKELLKTEVSKLIDFRNNVMHHKDISARQIKEGLQNEMLYRREDYDTFLDAYFWLLEELK